jgi:cyclic lactone autoinducer peptide
MKKNVFSRIVSIISLLGIFTLLSACSFAWYQAEIPQKPNNK